MNKYIIQIPKDSLSLIRGYVLQSHARTDIWQKEEEEAKVFKSLREAKKVAKRYGGEVVRLNCTCYYRSNQSHWCDKQEGKICKVTRQIIK